MRKMKTGVILIATGAITTLVTYSLTDGLIFFFSTLIGMMLVVLGFLQIWLDREGETGQ